MKIISTYIAAIVLGLVAIYFGVAQANKFQELQEVRLKHIDDNKTVSLNADVKEKELRSSKEEMVKLEQDQEALKQSLDSLKSTEASLKSDIAKVEDAKAALQAKVEEIAAARKKIADQLEKLGKTAEGNDLQAAVTATEQSKDALVQKIDELEVLISTAEKGVAAGNEEKARLAKVEEERVDGIKRNQMQAVITGVNQEWGFLVIGAGSNSGFTPQTSLLVQRDGRMIGRVRPSSIEPTQTIAEINFRTLVPGTRIQPGDQVIFEKP